MENNPAPISQIFTFENIEYSLQLSIINENLILSLKPINQDFPFDYEYKSNLEGLCKINNVFLIFDSLQEIKEFLSEFISKKENVSLFDSYTNEDEEEYIRINIKYNIGKINKSIRFDLIMIITDDKKMIKYMRKKLKQIKIDKTNESFLFSFDSKLITDISQINLIKTGIKNLDNSKKIKLTLLFRASRDGDTISSFHKKVDGIAPTISLIQTKNNNYIFGGFTEHSWDSSSGCVKTNNTFMFSFNKNKIYMGKNGGQIHCAKDYGPWFCGGAGVYQDHYFNTNNSYQWGLSSNKGSFDGFEEDFELVGGTKNFTVNEVEVFKVEYINI